MIDIIILSLSVDNESFSKTKNCIDSYIQTADELIGKIYVVESNNNFDSSYDNKKVEIIKPGCEFNYNKIFLT